MTNKRRIDVMLSSTSRDLPDHRELATNGILRAGMHPIIMETLTASTGDAISASLKLVDEAEIYMGIFGMRYGYIPDDDARNPDRISITEMEYRHAMKRGIPLLIFIMDKAHPLPDKLEDAPNFFEPSEEGKRKLADLKAELMDKQVVGFFKSPEDLRGHVMQALFNKDTQAKAYAIAGISVDPDPALPPAPPEFYADPPYRLTTEFIGRKTELAELDAWAASDDPMMIVEAIGGMGKSALTWEWVQEHARKKHTYDGVMWWSFYESGATMAAFVRHALAYLTRQHPDDLKGRNLRENLRELRLQLQKGRYLLVLDGLERVLVAYHRWDAAQMRDDTVEGADSIIKARDIRACTDPQDDEVLRDLLTCNRAKILLSSRLMPLALEDRTGTLSKGANRLQLDGLHPDDALALTRHAGITVGNVPQFKRFMGSFGYHSLLVKLVAGRVNDFRRGRGNFDAWYADQGRDLTVSDFDVKQSQTHILQYALDGLDAAPSRFLSQIAAFGDAVPYETLVLFNPFAEPMPVQEPNLFKELMLELADTEEERQHYQEEIDRAKAAYDDYRKSTAYRKALGQFDELLTDLEERGLLRWERDEDRYDMHPVVRGYAFDRLEDKTRTFQRIREYFEAQPADDLENAQEVADLSNTINIYRALLGAGQHDRAADFFDNRLAAKLHYNIAAYYTVIELLTPLFTQGTDQPPPLSSKSRQSGITSILAGMYGYIGRTAEALALQEAQLKLNIEADDLPNLIIGLLNYSFSLRADNRLALAVRGCETALALAEATENQSQAIDSTISLLGIYRDTGQWEKAEAAYNFLQDNPPDTIFRQADVEKYYAEMLIQRGRTADLDKAEDLALRGRAALSYRQIRGLRGEAALQAGDYPAAVRFFEEDAQLRRKAGSADVAVPLGGLARACALQGDHERALAIIETHDFDKDDVINVAEVYHLSGQQGQARAYARRAYEAAWADGPPYIRWWVLERAKAVLDALDEPHPVMPRYDEAKIGKLPYEDEIRAIIEREQNKRNSSDDDT